MRQTLCDGCGNQMEDRPSAGIVIDEQSIIGPDVSEELLGDYCDDCTEVVPETVRKTFSDE